jgi:hypothetical protein
MIALAVPLPELSQTVPVDRLSRRVQLGRWRRVSAPNSKLELVRRPVRASFPALRSEIGYVIAEIGKFRRPLQLAANTGGQRENALLLGALLEC